MITVAIFINGNPIYARTALNVTKETNLTDKENTYKVDDGTEIKHIPKEGAVALAKKMLDTIKEND